MFVTMEIIHLYAISMCSILLIPFVLRVLKGITKCLALVIPKYLEYPYALRRHKHLGPWTRLEVLLMITYVGANSICLSFGVSSLADSGIRAGHLSLANLLPLFLGPHLSFLADLIGISVKSFRKIHLVVASMIYVLTLFHALVIIGSGSTGSLAPLFFLHRATFQQ